MKKYTPNWHDPRVIAKTTSAIAWASQQLNEYKYSSWSSRHLDKKIGNISRDLGKYLRNQLLITHNSHYNMNLGKTKQYRLNIPGLVRLAESVGVEFNRKNPRRSIGIKTAKAQWDPVIQSGVFEYTEKSHRQYHPIQNIKTDIRRELFRSNGFCFNYDIENSYPTLIYQSAIKTQRIRKPLTALRDYVDNPTHYRAKLAKEIGCDTATAKQILIARFNGGTLRDSGKIRSLLSRIQFHKLKNNQWFCDFNNNLDRAWRSIARDQAMRTIPNTKKMKLYLETEQKVMKIIKREFSKKNYLMFVEHDGWRSNNYIDPYLLEIAVRKKLGYSIKIKLELL